MDIANAIGPFYTAFSSKAEIQSSKNLRLERVESNAGRNQFALYKSYGLKPFFPGSYAPTKLVNRGLFTDPTGDHLFAVQSDTIYDILSDGTLNPVVMPLGPMANDGRLCSMDSTINSLFVVSAGILYRDFQAALTTPAAALTDIDGNLVVASAVGVLKGLVILLQAGTNRFFFSDDDGATWDGTLQFQTAEGFTNPLLNLAITHEELWLFSNRNAQVYDIGSNADAPFVANTAGIIEMGLAAKFALAKLDNSLFWLGRNRDGEHQVWRANGYSPLRVSNNAVEAAIRSYPNVDDAIMQSYTLASPCIRLTFPSANDGLGTTFEFDVAANQWYELGWWNPALGRYERHRGNCYASAFGTIIVGDYANGYLYRMDEEQFTDFGYPIRWERRSPHFTADGKRIQLKRVDLFMQNGVGLTQPVWLNDHSLRRATFIAALAARVSAGTITAAQFDVMQRIYDWKPYNQDLALPAAAIMESTGFYDWGSNPEVGLRRSYNGGNSFGPVQYRSMGRAGEFDARTYWGGIGTLGMGRDIVLEFSGDAPTKTAIVQATAGLEPCLT